MFSSGHAYERETSGTTEETGATDAIGATEAIGANGVKMVRLSRISVFASFTTSVGIGTSPDPAVVSISVGAE